jgi:hypothetical protein
MPERLLGVTDGKSKATLRKEIGRGDLANESDGTCEGDKELRSGADAQ